MFPAKQNELDKRVRIKMKRKHKTSQRINSLILSFNTQMRKKLQMQKQI